MLHSDLSLTSGSWVDPSHQEARRVPRNFPPISAAVSQWNCPFLLAVWWANCGRGPESPFCLQRLSLAQKAPLERGGDTSRGKRREKRVRHEFGYGWTKTKCEWLVKEKWWWVRTEVHLGSGGKTLRPFILIHVVAYVVGIFKSNSCKLIFWARIADDKEPKSYWVASHMSEIIATAKSSSVELDRCYMRCIERDSPLCSEGGVVIHSDIVIICTFHP